MARIETLNCYDHATDLNEVTRISGYVAGKDNKHGIKGTVVSRDAEFLRKAALVGILESAGRAVAPASPQMMNPLTNSAITAPDSKMKRLQNDMSQGSSDTIGRVADYYMKTANNIFPVIEINGGQEVDIVFTKSVFRNNIKHQIDEYLD
jgi:conjugal transfer pilus assembly protein TraB